MKVWNTVSLATLALAAPLAASDGAAPPPSAPSEARPPLIPIEQLAARPIFTDAMMSPDGRYVAVKAVKDGKTSVSVLGTDSRSLVRATVMGEEIQHEWHRWAGSNIVLISVSQLMNVLQDEFRVTRLVALDVTTGARWFVGPRQMGVEGDDLLHVARDGSSVLLSFQKSIYDWPSVHRISLLDPEDRGEIVQRPVDGTWEWYADDAGVVRMGTGWRHNKLRVTYRKGAEEKFREIARIGEDDEDAVWEVSRIVEGSDEGYVLDADDDGRVTLKRFNYATREPIETIYRNADWDLSDVWLDRDGKPLAVDFTDERDRRVWLDPAMAKLQAGLEKALKADEVWIGSRAEDGKRMLVYAGGEIDPGQLFVYDAERRALDPFAIFRPGLDTSQLARPKPIDYAARDGTLIRGYLTLPRGREAKGLPLIILPHGGPYGVRDKLIYDDEVQLLANRGYAVLQPNYRGSDGYGEDFAELGRGQIGRGMQDDIDDAMDWAVKQGIADPARVCVVGASYGGYAAMWAAIRNPERYRCAASFAGVTDWKRQLRYDANFFSRKGSRKWRDRVRGEEDFDLDQVAPARALDRLERPMLVAHGKKDNNVPFSQFKLIAKAAEETGAPVEQLVFEDEGHGFANPENKAKWFATLTGFLARHNPAD